MLPKDLLLKLLTYLNYFKSEFDKVKRLCYYQYNRIIEDLESRDKKSIALRIQENGILINQLYCIMHKDPDKLDKLIWKTLRPSIPTHLTNIAEKENNDGTL